MSFFVKTAMKILPVTQNRISAPSNINNTRAFSVKTNSLPDDIFIKSAPANKISFNGLGRFDERFIPLCKDLQEYLAKNTPVNYDDITKIIRKYVQGIDLHKMSELSQKSKEGRVFMRSLFVVEDIAKGERIKESQIRSIRPGYGIPPKMKYQVVGKTAKKALKRGEPLSFGDWE